MLLLLALATALGLVLLAERTDDAPPAGNIPAPPAALPAPPSLGGPGAVALDRDDVFTARFRKPPRAGIVFDVGSGRVLWRRNSSAPLPIASLSKMMTALIVTERTSPDARVRINRSALDYEGRGVGLLPVGRKVPIEALLAGMLITSGNDAALALAEHVSGSTDRFVALMNRRAEQLGLRCSAFASPHGIEPGNRSCAADLAALARLDLRKPRIARVVGRVEAAVPFPIKGGRLFLTTTNPLLLSGYRGTIGLKTGFTREAGRCFVAVARRGRRTLGVVLLNSPDPGRQARRLLDQGFASGA